MWKIFKQIGEDYNEKEFQSVIDQVEALSADVSLSESQKGSMKSTLMASICADDVAAPAELEKVSTAVENVSQQSFLLNSQKKLLFQQILGSIQTRAGSWASIFSLARSWRAGIASVVTFTMMLSIFVVAPFELRLTRAAKWTFLESVFGEVYVNRDGRIFYVDKDFSIEEGDLVFTRSRSAVSIRYLDDSVTRLGENTSLEIKRLYVRPDNAVKTQVELSLIGGQVWASVYNLIDSESSFVIETGNARANVTSRAAFGLSSLENVTTLAVFDNVVDLSKKVSSVDYAQPVVAGFKAKISTSPFQVVKKDTGIVVEKINEEDDQWVITNIALDQEHQDKLKEENLEFVASSVSSDNTLGLLADFKDGTQALFANADVEQARQRFLDVHLGFIKAQEYLENASTENDFRHQATPLLIQYQTAVREIVESYHRLHDSDPEQADLLMSQMREEVDIQRKALSLVLPGEKLYTAKEVVMDTAGYFASDAAARSVYLLDRSKNRLLEVQNLIANNNLQDAESSFRAYLRGIDDLVNEVENAHVTELEKNLFALLHEQIMQFKQLTAIESELLAKGDMKWSGLVATVKEDSLDQLVNVVRYYRKNGIPFQLLMDLRNTAEEFFPDSDETETVLQELDLLMSDYPEYQEILKLQLPGPEVMEGEVIVDFEASKDLGICESDCAEK